MTPTQKRLKTFLVENLDVSNFVVEDHLDEIIAICNGTASREESESRIEMLERQMQSMQDQIRNVNKRLG